MKLRTPHSWKGWFVIGVLAVIVLGAGYYGARHLVWPAVKSWRIARMNREAREFYAKGDYTNALLTARKSLVSSTQNPDAWRIGAATAEAKQQPSAVWYQDSLCREEPTKKNYLELIRLALRFDVPGYAVDAVAKIAKEAKDDPEYHRMASQVFIRTGQPIAAQIHLAELTRLQPTDRMAQLDLAEIELALDPNGRETALRERVRAFAEEPEMRARALMLLLRDKVNAKATTGTEDLIARLQQLPSLDLPTRLLVIQGLHLLGRPEAAPLLATLKSEIADQPAQVAKVVEFLTRNGRGDEVRTWINALPAATLKDEEVQRAIAEALLKLRDEVALETVLRGGSWSKLEYLRQALLARAYRAQGRSAEFAEAWKLALIGVGTDLRKATALLARVDEWRWVNERHDVVWKIFNQMPTNETAQQALVIWERHQGNTANLNRLFSRMVEVSPGQDVARNNLAYTSLLLDSNVAKAGLIAAELANKQPQNPYFATTYALALYKQGHPAEALARLDALPLSQRSEPTRMLLRAMCLAALGQAGPAADLIGGVVLTEMLPEEKKMADGVMAEIARLDRVQGNRTRMLAYRQGPDRGSGAVGWLVHVSPVTRTAATSDMLLADSLYAAPDWDGLQDLLRGTNWKADDYLRAALQAYVLRRNGDDLQSSEAWRQAVALADRIPARLQNLRSLVTEWKWAPERLETQNLIFERTPTDHLVLAELLRTYRDAGKTADLHRVLGLYLGNNPDPTDEAVAHAYYSMLLDANLARAHVVARNAFEAVPADPVRRMVYAFSLWKQRRAAEAMPLLTEVRAETKSDLVSIPLIRAVVQTQLGAREAAHASLEQFKPDAALPEEKALAAKIAAQLAAQAEAARPAGT